MRRIKLTLAALTVMVAMLATASGSAMAQDLNCQDAWGNWISCDGTYYAPVDNSWWGNDWNNGWWGNNWWWSPWWWNDVQDCPFWGDTSGIVNQWDCFD